MGEDDGNVDEKHGLFTGGAKEGDAVEDVKREPTDCEEEKDEGQRLGQLEFFAKVTAGVCVARCHLERNKGRFETFYIWLGNYFTFIITGF